MCKFSLHRICVNAVATDGFCRSLIKWAFLEKIEKQIGMYVGGARTCLYAHLITELSRPHTYNAAFYNTVICDSRAMLESHSMDAMPIAMEDP